MPASVLVIDDDASILELVAYNLRRAGYEVLTAATGEDGLALAAVNAVDLVVLDIELPGKDGFEVCREFLHTTPELPILMLSARDSEIDRVAGFEIGIDDYVAKPFSPRELVGRVRAVLRRVRRGALPDPPPPTVLGPLTINIETQEVTWHGELMTLTPTEFGLLRVMMQRPGRVFSRLELINQVIGPDYTGDPRTIDVHIRHLRAKFEVSPSMPSIIETVRGAGYKFVSVKPDQGNQ